MHLRISKLDVTCHFKLQWAFLFWRRKMGIQKSKFIIICTQANIWAKSHWILSRRQSFSSSKAQYLGDWHIKISLSFSFVSLIGCIVWKSLIAHKHAQICILSFKGQNIMICYINTQNHWYLHRKYTQLTTTTKKSLATGNRLKAWKVILP